MTPILSQWAIIDTKKKSDKGLAYSQVNTVYKCEIYERNYCMWVVLFKEFVSAPTVFSMCVCTYLQTHVNARGSHSVPHHDPTNIVQLQLQWTT